MADTVLYKPNEAANGLQKVPHRLVDNGDGTYSEAVAAAVTSTALPTGAATAAKQDTGNTSLGSIDTKLSSQATAANQATANTSLASLVTQTDGIETSVDGIEALLTTVSAKLTGAPNIAIGQVTAGAASDVLAAARATRRTIVVRNHDASVSAYIGTGTVTSGNGFLLKAGESIAIETIAALNCIRDTTDAVLGFVEIYD